MNKKSLMNSKRNIIRPLHILALLVLPRITSVGGGSLLILSVLRFFFDLCSSVLFNLPLHITFRVFAMYRRHFGGQSEPQTRCYAQFQQFFVSLYDFISWNALYGMCSFANTSKPSLFFELNCLSPLTAHISHTSLS